MDTTTEKVRQLLNAGAVRFIDAEPLIKDLKASFDFGLARKLLKRCHADVPAPRRTWAQQQLAFCTYKDEELPPDARLSDALKILDAIGLRDPKCGDPETLGLGGAIYKRRWERSGQIEDLHIALYFYRQGWMVDPFHDLGYCGVNAVYVLDLLAHRTRTAAAREKIAARQADEYRRDARALREDMQRTLPGLADERARVAQAKGRPADDPRQQWWYLVTRAEVAFGLGEWQDAAGWLAKARVAEHSEWQLQTTARQLVALARLHDHLPPAENIGPADWSGPWRALHALLGDDARAAIDSYRGKVGLALSGGGFRASLFHLGVLARLAECDALRSVEVLSTVSGGSIIGAHYYLALRHRLQTTTDGHLDREQYRTLVREVMDQFCAGVLRNLRVRALSSLWANLKMMFTRTYGRSNRMGELYEKYLFSAVPDGGPRAGLRKLCELLIHPLMSRDAGAAAPIRDEGFKPKFSNWRRRAKVPILLLNTTSLNSGHNWHFTASWMGEPPGLTGQEVDMNERYRRLYYWQAPTQDLRDYPLAYAVAASAGVPALFDPLVLKRLYPERILKLVDGGVHDNQGVAGALDEGCNLILCSDASGQMDDQTAPASGILSVFFRANSILQDRLREAQYQDLDARARSRALQGLFFVHLKQGLDTDPLDWIKCQDPSQPADRSSRTSYGVHRKIQKLVSEMRTDLDTFTQVEACALMASGYLMTAHQLRQLNNEHNDSGLPGDWAGYEVEAASRNDWPFSPLLPVMAADPDGSDPRARDLARQLRASRLLFGKVWILVPALSVVAIALGVAAVAVGAWWVYEHWRNVYPARLDLSVRQLALGLGLLVLGMLLPLATFFKPAGAIRRWLVMGVLATVGWVATNLHLLLIEPLYRRRGRLNRLMQLPGE